MVFQKINDQYVLKKKFTFAAIVLAIGTVFAAKGVWISESPEQLVVVLSAYGTFAGWLLSLVFAADVADKKFNNGSYHPE